MKKFIFNISKIFYKIMVFAKLVSLAIFMILSGTSLALDIPAPSGAKTVGDTKAIEDTKNKAEAEAKAKAANEAKLKADADARSKLEAVAKAKAANEAKLKADADARSKLEAEAKVKAANETKLKADARSRLEAEAKTKAANDDKLKAEADAKSKLEAQAKMKAENELRLATEARMKAEMYAKTAAELKAKSEAENKSVNYKNNEKLPRSDIGNEARLYDGLWQGAMFCGQNFINNRPSYKFQKEFKISDGIFKDQVISKNQLGTAIEEWNGRLYKNSIDILVSGKRDNGDSWEIRFSGPAVSTVKFDLKGALFDLNNVKVRDCEISLIKS